MVVDSTVLVDLIRGREPARKYIEQKQGGMTISRAGVMELVRGTKTKRELNTVFKMIRELRLEVVEISEDVSEMAGSIFEQYWHSQGLGAMDAFVAATVMVKNEKLATHNTKHFRFIKGLDLIVPY